MDASQSPLAVLSLMVAPAILTNASTVLVMSTSNRLARAADRVRELAKQLEASGETDAAQSARRLNELGVTEQRMLMLLSALRSFYVALGGFATATLAALLGAVLAAMIGDWVAHALELIGLAAGLVGLAALVHGASVLVRETRLVVRVLNERAAAVRARMQNVRR
jgi:Protein of unknown function (DUF2721)